MQVVRFRVKSCIFYFISIKPREPLFFKACKLRKREHAETSPPPPILPEKQSEKHEDIISKHVHLPHLNCMTRYDPL